MNKMENNIFLGLGEVGFGGVLFLFWFNFVWFGLVFNER